MTLDVFILLSKIQNLILPLTLISYVRNLGFFEKNIRLSWISMDMNMNSKIKFYSKNFGPKSCQIERCAGQAAQVGVHGLSQ